MHEYDTLSMADMYMSDHGDVDVNEMRLSDMYNSMLT